MPSNLKPPRGAAPKKPGQVRTIARVSPSQIFTKNRLYTYLYIHIYIYIIYVYLCRDSVGTLVGTIGILWGP